jgi:hypothetical protein
LLREQIVLAPSHQRKLGVVRIGLTGRHLNRAVRGSMLRLHDTLAPARPRAPHATDDASERARRQHHLQIIEATYDPLPFDTACARAYGTVFAAISATGRKPRGRRAVELLIAATAIANQLPIYTRNPRDLNGLDHLVQIIDANQA